MGLDGISPNQLRNFNELNTLEGIIAPNQNSTRIVDELSKGQKVNPDKEKQHEKNSNPKFSKNDEEDQAEIDEQNNEEFNSYKIDLSQANKYELKVNENSDCIVIVEKETQKTVQIISADNLAVFIRNLAQATGSIVNRKF